MTREEQIRKAAKRYVKDIVTPLPASLMAAFVKGAEYADEHPINYDGKAMLHVLNKGHGQGWKDAINKSYDLLIERYENQGVILLEDINEFKQIMEESNEQPY